MNEQQKKTKTLGGKKYGGDTVNKIYLSNAALQQKYGIGRARLALLRNEQNGIIFIYSLNNSMTQKMAA